MKKTPYCDDENFIFFGATAGGGSVRNDDGSVRPKQIMSHENNALIGKYFRRKLGVPYGALITKEHLIEYGKTYVDFYKVDDETFLMDF